jgi:hypothetical protein
MGGVTVEELAPEEGAPGQGPYRQPLALPGVQIRWRWIAWHHIFNLAILLVIFGLIGFLSALGLWFLCGGMVIFAPYLYRTLAGLVNRSRITLRDRRIQVEHGPLPLRLSLFFTARRVNRVCCERLAPATAYDVVAVLPDGGRVLLLEDMPSEEQAELVRARIERWLKENRT